MNFNSTCSMKHCFAISVPFPKIIEIYETIYNEQMSYNHKHKLKTLALSKLNFNVVVIQATHNKMHFHFTKKENTFKLLEKLS